MPGPRAIIVLLALAGSLAASPLDQGAVHAAYEEGDFDKVVSRIEAFEKTNPGYSREDSVFIAKHLAVIYAANPETLEKGKYWMYQMLRIMPAADLVDMYVSEEIDRIFEKIRVEFTRRQAQFGVDTARMVLPPKQPVAATARPASKPPSGPHPRPAQKESGWGKTALWVGGSVGLVAAGTGAYFLFSRQEGGTRVQEVDIPKQVHP